MVGTSSRSARRSTSTPGPPACSLRGSSGRGHWGRAGATGLRRRAPRPRAPPADGSPAFDVEVLGTAMASACGDVRIEIGGTATLMVRPERVRITTDEPTDGGSVRATVTDLTFQGPLVRLLLVAADGSSIVAQLGPEVELPLLPPGDEGRASWPRGARV